MAKGLYLVFIVTGYVAHIHASAFVNGKDATSFLRTKRSSSCLSESYCESNYVACSTDAEREAIRESKCSGVQCPSGKTCALLITNSQCTGHATTQCVNDITQNASESRTPLIVAITDLCVSGIELIVLVVVVVYIFKKKGKVSPLQFLNAKESSHENENNIPVVLEPANTTFRNK